MPAVTVLMLVAMTNSASTRCFRFERFHKHVNEAESDRAVAPVGQDNYQVNELRPELRITENTACWLGKIFDKMA
jgi:hypothetical protein